MAAIHPKHEICPRCHAHGRVINSRPTKAYRRRRWECGYCGHRWNSFEDGKHPKDYACICNGLSLTRRRLRAIRRSAG